MSPFHRFSARVACALCLVAFSQSPAPASQTDPLAWRDASEMQSLIDHLELWLDAHSDLPRRTSAPLIRLVGADRVASLQATSRSSKSAHTRGLYDPETATVYLVRPWESRDPHDVSVLLHELVHHRQAEAGHWYCAGAQELPAYRLQEAWLAAQGLRANVNWIAVVLDSGCTPRDIHPD